MRIRHFSNGVNWQDTTARLTFVWDSQMGPVAMVSCQWGIHHPDYDLVQTLPKNWIAV
jgi:hypothetical protein